MTQIDQKPSQRPKISQPQVTPRVTRVDTKEAFDQKPDRKGRRWPIVLAIGTLAVGATLFSIFGGNKTSAGDTQATTTSQPNTPTTPTTGGEVPDPVIAGPFQDVERNLIYQDMAEKIKHDGTIPLTQSFFETQLNGDYELAFAIWIENLEQALNEGNDEYLAVAFSADSDDRLDDFRLIFWNLADYRNGLAREDINIWRADVTGSFRQTGTYDDGAIGVITLGFRPGTAESWLQEYGGQWAGSAEGCKLGFEDGLLKNYQLCESLTS